MLGVIGVFQHGDEGGSSWEFCASKEGCMIKTGKPSAAISGRWKCSEALLSGSMVDM